MGLPAPRWGLSISEAARVTGMGVTAVREWCDRWLAAGSPEPPGERMLRCRLLPGAPGAEHERRVDPADARRVAALRRR